jgi:KDO2-lipid IV(A) lauroyltransferase
MEPRSTFRLFKALSAAIEAVPLELCQAVASGVAGALASRGGAVAKQVRENLEAAVTQVPDAPIDDALMRRFVTRAFRGYGRYWVEGAKLPELPPSKVANRMVISEGLEHLVAAKAEGRGVVVALPHVGSWEWGGAYLDQIDLHLTAVAEALEPPEMFEWFVSKREAIGITILPLDARSGTAVAKVLAEGGIVGLLCDRDLQGNGIEVDFLGRRAKLPAGPATLALRSGAALLTAAVYSGPGEQHHAAILPAINTEREGKLRQDVARVTQDIADALAGLIRREPTQWHVFQPLFEDAATRSAGDSADPGVDAVVDAQP